jgi:cyclopropane fatty-acyl-phospholipid synthase-like methyltransferase
MDAASRLSSTIIPNAVKGSRLFRLARLARHILAPHDTVYDQDYYDTVVEVDAARSADVMAASIVERFKPKTAIDVGCGTGALLAAFRKLDCEVCGLEYSEAGLAYCRNRGLPVRKFNIEKDDLKNESYDLATSFEVAEHLPPWVASRYVSLLCTLSPVVVMSAATPGQIGTDHVNEQPRSYWINKFENNHYSFEETSTQQMAQHWKISNVANFYYDNVMVFLRR